MQEIKLRSGKSAVVIVAHPDDETIWMGGTIMGHPEIDWTVLSLCRLSDDDRRPKFRRVCRRLNCRALMADVEDEDVMTVAESIAPIRQAIRTKIGKQTFDYVFTHGQNGEYGHKRHVGVYQAVNEVLEAGFLKPETVFYFSFRRNRKKKPLMLAAESAELFYRLEAGMIEEKRRIVAEMYGYPLTGIDVNLCTDPEAFTRKK